MTRRVDYDRVAATYNSRYERNNYTGVEQALASFVEDCGAAHNRVLEIGCGTGHWVRRLRESDVIAFGLDFSAGMLGIGRDTLPGCLIRGRADSLPCRSASCDRLFCVNALHHFSDKAAFLMEAKRVLRFGGGVLTIGLDPHNGDDRWWVYDYFPGALAEDRKRYLPTARIRELMDAVGFCRCETRIIQHLPREMSVGEARSAGFLNRTGASQLMVITDEEYEAGLKRIHSADDRASAGAKILRSDLRLYATIGWVNDRDNGADGS
jgi:ubiquinone/menaquinone biosynthesis C-methylase UbiE